MKPRKMKNKYSLFSRKQSQENQISFTLSNALLPYAQSFFWSKIILEWTNFFLQQIVHLEPYRNNDGSKEQGIM